MILVRRCAKAQRKLLRPEGSGRIGVEPNIVRVLIVLDGRTRRKRSRDRLVADRLTLIEEHERRRDVKKRLRRRSGEQDRFWRRGGRRIAELLGNAATLALDKEEIIRRRAAILRCLDGQRVNAEGAVEFNDRLVFASALDAIDAVNLRSPDSIGEVDSQRNRR